MRVVMSATTVVAFSQIALDFDDSPEETIEWKIREAVERLHEYLPGLLVSSEGKLRPRTGDGREYDVTVTTEHYI